MHQIEHTCECYGYCYYGNSSHMVSLSQRQSDLKRRVREAGIVRGDGCKVPVTV